LHGFSQYHTENCSRTPLSPPIVSDADVFFANWNLVDVILTQRTGHFAFMIGFRASVDHPHLRNFSTFSCGKSRSVTAQFRPYDKPSGYANWRIVDLLFRSTAGTGGISRTVDAGGGCGGGQDPGGCVRRPGYREWLADRLLASRQVVKVLSRGSARLIGVTGLARGSPPTCGSVRQRRGAARENAFGCLQLMT
jgi:hypothetical protein